MLSIVDFAKLVEQQQIETAKKRWNFSHPGWEESYHAKVIEGNKYTKVDIGSSGKFMIDKEGNIFGIKGYGQVNKKKQYGTLSTTDQYFWGEYTPVKKL